MKRNESTVEDLQTRQELLQDPKCPNVSRQHASRTRSVNFENVSGSFPIVLRES
jgi:hypothetical protein